MKVAVCILTYRRPAGLTRLLEGLAALTFEGDPPDVRCLVVDNDDAGSARAVCQQVSQGYRWRLDYHMEPRRGIPQARNAAITQTAHDADYLAYIDDDEVPEPNWLDELLRVGRLHDADVVTGPVAPHFTDPPPAWLIKGRFLEKPRPATGTLLDRAFTGNVLFRAALVRDGSLRFDERLALTGGEDGHFFRRVHRAGHRIVWADDAVAHEWTSGARLTARWILRRAYRIGTATTHIELDLRPVPSAVVLVLTLGGYRILKGLLLWPVCALFSHHLRVRYLRQVYYGAGLLAGLTGHRYEEYRETTVA
ncbi:MAG: glycosyltransferase family 2 protein [Phycisphaerae bacterium]